MNPEQEREGVQTSIRLMRQFLDGKLDAPLLIDSVLSFDLDSLGRAILDSAYDHATGIEASRGTVAAWVAITAPEEDGMPTLNNWTLTMRPIDPYLAIEYKYYALLGNVTGHPNFEDGHQITTQRLLSIKDGVAATQSRDYRLGMPDPKFVAYLTSIGKSIHDYASWPHQDAKAA